ncbi:hypothetical protein HGA92_03750 [Candidatus Gracilibacteria bacterium]|nr:hypothetical protein [Candidatus Gracilibacteria bacterium]NUJ99212.1 hypothetical protein [Candidatus Gracilibacteria bacterium]
MKNVLLKSVFIIFSLFIGIFSTQADNTITIKELQKNIQTLTEEKKSKWESFRQENGKINNFIEVNLDNDSLLKIEEFVNSYYSKKDELEKKIEEKAKQSEDIKELKEEILKIKLDLYKKFVPYIKKDQLQEYLSYIKGNIETEITDKNIKEEIIKNQEIINKRISEIKEKIEENKKVLEAKIEEAVKQKLEEKIKIIRENEKFKKLSEESKRSIFESTLKRIVAKKEILEKIENKTSIVQKKIEVYEIVEKRLKEVIKSL